MRDQYISAAVVPANDICTVSSVLLVCHQSSTLQRMPSSTAVRATVTSHAAENDADTFALFGFAWGFATLIHQAVFQFEWLNPGVFYVPGWVLTVAAVLVLIRPSSPHRLLFLALMDVIWQVEQMPYRPNHIFFTALVNLTLVLAIGKPALSHAIGALRRADRMEDLDRSDLLHRFAGIVRIEVVLLYAFAALAKFNYDYLDPRVSCAVTMSMESSDWLGSDWLGMKIQSSSFPAVAIWTTIVVEVLIPVALVVPRTRTLGIIIGSLFHFVLAFHPETAIVSFSAMAPALYVLFAPPWFATALKEWWRGRLATRGLRSELALAAGLLSLSVVAVVVMTDVGDFRALVRSGRFGIWLIWATLSFLLFCILMVKHRGPMEPRPIPPGRRPSTIAWAVPLIVLFTGMNPYLGLRTQTSFTMFSNLRTEGGQTNHFFMPLSWHFAGWQKDVVQPLASSHGGLDAARDTLLT